jgi:hypothetical protein
MAVAAAKPRRASKNKKKKKKASRDADATPYATITTAHPSMISHIVPEISPAPAADEADSSSIEGDLNDSTSQKRGGLFAFLYKKKTATPEDQLAYEQMTTRYPSTIGMFAGPPVQVAHVTVAEDHTHHSIFSRFRKAPPPSTKKTIELSTAEQSYAQLTTTYPTTINLFAQAPITQQQQRVHPPHKTPQK